MPPCCQRSEHPAARSPSGESGPGYNAEHVREVERVLAGFSPHRRSAVSDPDDGDLLLWMDAMVVGCSLGRQIEAERVKPRRRVVWV
jgi:hypothetical protein